MGNPKANFNTSAKGFCDVQNVDRATKRHDKCCNHIDANTISRLKVFGRVPINELIDVGARLQRANFNSTVRGNRCVYLGIHSREHDDCLHTFIYL